VQRATALLRLNFIALGVLFAGSVLAWPALPDRIPIHFGVSGEPDVWVARTWLSWLALPTIALGMFALLHGVGRLSANRPHLWNVPEKQKFLKLSEHERAPIVELLLRYLSGFTLGLTAFFCLIQLCIFQVATGQAQRLPWFFSAGLILMLVGVIIGALGLNQRIKQRILTATRPVGTAR
jgi:uncharacterized membrane protein